MNKFKIEYYTDPLCCWSWAMEPALRKLRYLLADRLEMSYVMGGLLLDWEHYSDKLNDIKRPSQLGPLWMEAKHMSGQPIDESIWVSNPVDSSYPACMAVKAAGSQSKIAEEAVLRELREAVMMEKKNIGEIDVILKIAEDLEVKEILDLKKFKESFFGDEAGALFQKDLDKVKIKGISRFPSMLISYRGKTVQITGYRPFSVLLDTFRFLDKELDIDDNIDAEEYKQSWANLTKQELKVVTEDFKEKEPVTPE